MEHEQVLTELRGGGPDELTGLCLLSLDGGGVRGLSSLYILKGLMQRVNARRKAAGKERVKPCQIFDLIGGTSTGGLIAIMLGRLEMEVEECILAYKSLCSQVFIKERVPLSWSGKIKGRFDTKKLEQVIKEFIGQHINGKDPETELFNDNGNSERSCKVFVCATRKKNVNSTARIRSYNSDRQAISDNATIWEAARATSAATTFFEPISISGLGYADGAFGANNPVNEVWAEARDIWAPGKDDIGNQVKCLVSIGTGNPGMQPIKDGPWAFASETLVQIATETEKTAEKFEQEHNELFLKNRLFRFNVDQGLQGVGLEEYLREEEILTATSGYMESQRHVNEVSNCAESLQLKQTERIVANFFLEDQNLQPPEAPLLPLPYSRNLDFVGRKSELTQLSQDIEANGKSRRWTALYGLSGVGKSQIAIEAAYRYQKGHPNHLVLWVHASSEDRFRQSLSEIARAYCVPGYDQPHTDLVKATQHWLRVPTSPPWLMIIDNADDENLFFAKPLRLAQYIPECAHGAVVVTSRNKKVADKITKYRNTIHVKEMSESDSGDLVYSFFRHTRRDKIMEADLRALSSHLGCLPLALAQAAAYIQENSLTLSDYIKMCEASVESVGDLMSTDFEAWGRDSEVSNAVVATMRLSLDNITRRNPEAMKIVSLMSFFDRQAVPETLLLDVGENPLNRRFVEAIGELRAFSLISKTPNESAFEMHRLVHIITYKWLSEQPSFQKIGMEALIRARNSFPVRSERKDFRRIEVNLPHTLQVLSCHRKIGGSIVAEHYTLTRDVAEHLHYNGRKVEAFELRVVALQMSEKLFSPGAYETLRARFGVAETMNDLHRYKEAEGLCLDVVRDSEASNQRNHTYINTLQLLSRIYLAENKLELAHKFNKNAKKTAADYLGINHKDTIVIDFQAAEILRHQKQLKDAEEVLKAAIKALKNLKGDHTTLVVSGMQNLSNILDDQYQMKASESICSEIVDLQEHSLGPDHLETLIAIRNLADCYLQERKLDEAMTLVQQVLHRSASILGEHHPENLRSKQVLARIYLDKWDEEEAERIQSWTLNECKEIFGLDHPQTWSLMLDLAGTFSRKRDFHEAEKLEKEVLRRRERVLGPDHPDTLESIYDLSVTWEAMDPGIYTSHRAAALRSEYYARSRRKDIDEPFMEPKNNQTLALLTDHGISESQAGDLSSNVDVQAAELLSDDSLTRLYSRRHYKTAQPLRATISDNRRD